MKFKKKAEVDELIGKSQPSAKKATISTLLGFNQPEEETLHRPPKIRTNGKKRFKSISEQMIGKSTRKIRACIICGKTDHDIHTYKSRKERDNQDNDDASDNLA